MHTTQQRQPSGIISILALILMSTITAAALGTATVILNELRQSENLDQAIVSVYASESGLEDGLFQVKLNRQSKTLNETVAALTNPTIATPRQTLGNASNWTRTASTESQFKAQRLGPNQTATLDIFDPDSPAVQSGINSLKIDWKDDCNGFAWLEVTMLTWDNTTSVVFDPASQQIFKTLNSCVSTGTRCTTITLNSVDGVDINPQQVYRFAFRAISPAGTANTCNVENLVVTAYDPTGVIKAIPARITVKTTGKIGNARQSLTASVPWRTPVSGLLNFVIFSEEDIVK